MTLKQRHGHWTDGQGEKQFLPECLNHRRYTPHSCNKPKRYVLFSPFERKKWKRKIAEVKWFITVWGREAAMWRPRFSARSIWPPKLIPSPGHGARCHSIIWFRNAPLDRPFWWTVTFLEAPLSLMSRSSTWPPTTICPTARTVRMGQGWGEVSGQQMMLFQ